MMRFKMYDESAVAGVTVTAPEIGAVPPAASGAPETLLVDSAPVAPAEEGKTKRRRTMVGLPTAESVQAKIASVNDHLAVQAQALRDQAKQAKANIDEQLAAQAQLDKASIDEKLRTDLTTLRNSHKTSIANWQRVLDTIQRGGKEVTADDAEIDALMADPAAVPAKTE